MRHKYLSTWASLFVVVGLLLTVAAGCSSDTASSSSSPEAAAAVAEFTAEEIIEQSNAKMAAVKSASFAVDMALEVQGDTAQATDPMEQALLSEGMTLHAEGKSAAEPVAAQMDLSVTVADQALDFGLIAKGDKMWVEYEGQWYVVDQKNSSALSTQAETGAAPTEQLKSFGLDPEEWGTTYEVVGTEDIGGTPTYHLKATSDPQKLAAALMQAANDPDLAKKLGDAETANQLKQSLAQSEEQAAQLQKALTDVSVDYWVGVDDMLMRKAEFTAALDTTEQKDMEGVEGMTMKLTVTMDDFNEPVSVDPPAKAKSFDKLMETIFGGMTMGL